MTFELSLLQGGCSALPCSDPSQHFIRSLDQTVPSVSRSACPSDLSKDRDYLNLFSPPLTIFIPVSVGVIELSALGKRLTGHIEERRNRLKPAIELGLGKDVFWFFGK